jgi:N-acetyl-gamma-glutamyl-phosphate reductase
MTTRVFIDGEAGTTGLQIRDRLAGRRDLALVRIHEAHRKDAGARAEALNDADIAILCLPDEAAVEAVSLIDNPATRVIDASSAHRTAPGWTYGFPEMAPGQGEAIARAGRLSNPGCWPQGYIAMVRPLVEAGLVPAGARLTYHGVSGYSGGGRKMIEEYEAPSFAAPAFLPYGLTLHHKHLPEMVAHGGLAAAPVFQPAVLPVAQGMLGVVPLHLDALPGRVTATDLHAALAERYAACRFVEVAALDMIERSAGLDPRSLNGTNVMRLHVFANDGKALLIAVYDNLGKGAGGAAVQNLNLMTGAGEAEGLTLASAA